MIPVKFRIKRKSLTIRFFFQPLHFSVLGGNQPIPPKLPGSFPTKSTIIAVKFRTKREISKIAPLLQSLHSPVREIHVSLQTFPVLFPHTARKFRTKREMSKIRSQFLVLSQLHHFPVAIGKSTGRFETSRFYSTYDIVNTVKICIKRETS